MIGLINLADLNLEAIRIEDKSLFDTFLNRTRGEFSPIQASEYNFTNIFMWRKHYGFRFLADGNFLVIIAYPEDRDPFALFPLGDGTAEELDSVIERLKIYFNLRGFPLVFERVPENAMKYFEKRLDRQALFDTVIKEDRNNSDYIYLAGDMISLKGKKYDGKRNHINKFKRLHIHEYLPLDSGFIEDCIRVEEEWCRSKKCSNADGLLQEKAAIMEALKNYEQLGFSGGVVKVDGRVEAFTLGEILNSSTAVIHIEKANANIEGLYTYINQKFCEYCWSTTTYINREQDLGVEGIRKAKLSYHPVNIIKKYSVIIK